MKYFLLKTSGTIKKIKSFSTLPCLVQSLTLIRLEWGSVQMNPASTNFTLFRAFSLRKHRPNSSLDSSAHEIHSNGGCRYRSQLRQNCNVPCLGMSCVMSTCVRKHDTHILAGFGSMVTPHWQHNLRRKNATSLNRSPVIYRDRYFAVNTLVNKL